MALVLIVDDQSVNRELVASLLHYSGHEALQAGDGVAALDLVRARRPALVICDILMPVMDGYEFVRALRAEPTLADTPVMFYSATFLEAQARDLAQRCGVSEVLVKPCEPEEILAAVHRALALAPQASPAAMPEPPEVSAEFDRQHLRLVTDKLLGKVQELEAANHRLTALVESAMDAIVGIDAGQRVVLFNPAAERMFGYAAHEMLGEPLDRLLPEGARAEHAAHIEAFGADPRRHRTMGQARVVRGLRRNGESFPVEASIAKIGHDGMRYTAILRDVTERLQAEERIRRLARVATVLSDINSLIVRVRQRDELFSEACRIAVDKGRFNKAWIGRLRQGPDGLDTLDLMACSDGDSGYQAALQQVLQQPPAQDQARFAAALRARQPLIFNDLLQGPPDLSLRELAIDTGSRAIAWLPLATAAGAVGVLVLHADTAGFFDDEEMQLLKELAGDMSFALEHIDQQEHLQRLAYCDPLTGLPNESLLREQLTLLLPVPCGHRLALTLIDLVHFKRINDTLGRHCGDLLLQQVAQRLTQRAGERGRVARIVADRFAVVLPELDSDTDLALAVADAYQRCFDAPFPMEGETLRLSACMGIAVCPDDGHDAEALIRHAEAALKAAKAGTSPVVFYDPRMSAAVAEALALENQLRRALERGEFVLHYQPKVDVDSRRILGLEALLRWQSPERGLVSPLAFIPLLEETGLIVPVGLWALRQAAQDHRRWRERFGQAPTVAVNVSAVQLHREGFVDEVLAVLEAEGAGRGAIDLEITESLVMQDVEGAITKLNALRAKGVSMSLDDFGTGYSSLAYLSKLPVQVLKIDRSFIGAMLTDPDAMTLVSTMISLAHSLRMQVVAEGVETEEQAKILRLLRCDQMQGYLVCRPINQELMAERLGGEG